ncbi:hypothetical protein ACIRG5_38480 [Lentzea sp. NPDC102401]|uniref:hypothetical protein n=1 Tax=Lentzea sp. NPDC102401 TaxID=3364128 RepID=UPI003824A4B4
MLKWEESSALLFRRSWGHDVVRWYFAGLVLSFFGTTAALFASSLHTPAAFPLVEHGLRYGPEFLGVLAAARGAGWLTAVLVSGFVNGVGLAWTVIAVATLVQQRTPPAVLGQVSATAMTIVFGAVDGVRGRGPRTSGQHPGVPQVGEDDPVDR